MSEWWHDTDQSTPAAKEAPADAPSGSRPVSPSVDRPIISAVPDSRSAVGAGGAAAEPWPTPQVDASARPADRTPVETASPASPKQVTRRRRIGAAVLVSSVLLVFFAIAVFNPVGNDAAAVGLAFGLAVAGVVILPTTTGRAGQSRDVRAGHRNMDPLPLGARTGAYLLDAILIILTLVVGWMIWSLVLWKHGQSPGKRMVGAVVVDSETGEVADVGRMAVREFIGKGFLFLITLGIASIVSVFMVLGRRDHRAVHDMVAGTIVVRSPGRDVYGGGSQ